MKKKNWKTTAIGIVTAICYMGYKILAKETITGEDITLALGLIGLGYMTKDKDVTGGTR
jgi:hypothetical protein